MSGREKGFTLIEVLISGLILFSVLAVGTVAYRTSIALMDKITATTLISRALPSVMENVKTEIFQKKTEGHGFFNDTITYTWRCTPAKTSKNILSAHDEFTGSLEYGSFNITLNNVFLTIKYESDISTKETSYEYRELLWSR